MTLQEWPLKLLVLVEDLQKKELVPQLVGLGSEYILQRPPDQLIPSSPLHSITILVILIVVLI
jgi:hypothetical protein